jgi:hypothetical protein
MASGQVLRRLSDEWGLGGGRSLSRCSPLLAGQPALFSGGMSVPAVCVGKLGRPLQRHSPGLLLCEGEPAGRNGGYTNGLFAAVSMLGGTLSGAD